MPRFTTPLNRFRSESNWLSSEFKRIATEPKARGSQLACEMAVIRLHDAWARYCRELVILSARGRVTTLGGRHLRKSHPSITNHGSVVPVLLTLYRKRAIYEPHWEKAADCIDAAQRLGINNLTEVSAALGAANSPAEVIRHVRNFYAHRRKGASQRALGTGQFMSRYHPVAYELNAFTAGGNTIFDSWVESLDAIAVAALQ